MYESSSLCRSFPSFYFLLSPSHPPPHCQKNLRMILSGSPHPFGGTQYSSIDRKWDGGQQRASVQNPPFCVMELTAIWKRITNHGGLSVAPAICSDHWHRNLSHCIFTWFPIRALGFFMRKDPPCESSIRKSLTQHQARWSKYAGFLKVAFTFFHEEMSFQCMQFQSYVTWKNWIFYVFRAAVRKLFL